MRKRHPHLGYRVWRGDDVRFKEFDSRKIGTGFLGRTRGIGFWFTDDRGAAGFFGHIVRPFTLFLGSPRIFTADEFRSLYPKGPSDLARMAEVDGHDACVIRDIQDGDRISNVFCVFNAGQIGFGHYGEPRELPNEENTCLTK